MHPIPALVSAARSTVSALPTTVDVIVYVDDPARPTSLIAGRIAEQGSDMQVALVPWFAELGDTSLLTRAVSDASLGLVVISAPIPDDLTAETSSPLDDALSLIKSSVLLLRA